MTQTDTPKRYAVVGNPVAHSRSPFIHDTFARQTGVSLVYDLLPAPLDAFVDTVQEFFDRGGAGLNVTVPFKEEAFRLAGENLSDRARLAGAANTLWMQDGALHACNTDGMGLLGDLRRIGQDPSGRRVLLVGAGGAARGVLLPLLHAGCAHLHIVNRTAERASALVKELATMRAADVTRVTSGGLHDAGASWDIVINATSSSLGSSPPDLPPNLYAEGALAYDMVYGSTETPFMRAAEAQGVQRRADGLGMLVGQAAESFFIWHGVMPEVEPVIKDLRRLLRES